MTLQEKIDRYMAETREQRVGAWTAAPPLIRLLWKLRVDVPPPFYWTFGVRALTLGGFFAFWMFCWNALLLGMPWRGGIIAAIAGGLFFGVTSSWYLSWNLRRKFLGVHLSAWSS
jgi:hypothetical protein